MWCVDFPNFGIILTQWNESKFWVCRYFLDNGLKFGMLMYPDHFQIWLNFGHCLLTFLIMAQFWQRNGTNVVVMTIILTIIGENSHKHCMMLYEVWNLDHICDQNGESQCQKEVGYISEALRAVLSCWIGITGSILNTYIWLSWAV